MAAEKPSELVAFTPHDHDVRVERGDWVFYVRGVKRCEPFRGDATWDGTAFGLVMLVVAWVVAHLFWGAQRRWKVGVLRYRSGWRGGRIRLVHKEMLARGEQPQSRIAELVAEVEAGRFDVEEAG